MPNWLVDKSPHISDSATVPKPKPRTTNTNAKTHTHTDRDTDGKYQKLNKPKSNTLAETVNGKVKTSKYPVNQLYIEDNDYVL